MMAPLKIEGAIINLINITKKLNQCRYIGISNKS